MTTIVLSAAGAAVGGFIGGPSGALTGVQIASAAAPIVNDLIIGSPSLPNRTGPRLQDLHVQTSTYGRVIPIVYGNMRIAGNVIWSRPIQETETTTTSGGGKGGGGKARQSSTTYSYSVDMAIAICEGEIDEVQRIWADSLQLDLSQGTYRVYKGSETQLADSFIESFEGVGSTPAYRGLAYVVVEDFPLAAFGNRIPNFTFEVKKKALPQDTESGAVEQMVKSITLIPGSGEFVYDTQLQYKVPGEMAASQWIQQGQRSRINQHNLAGSTNVALALDQLAETLPNLEWVSVVCNWFGTSMDIASCDILPGVEYQEGATTEPEVWSVAGYDRSTAHLVTLDAEGNPVYGGTPDDESILRLLDELNARGYNVMFYPMMLMDTSGKPWRGYLAGDASAIPSFFAKTNGYNNFITHYANLVKTKVDAFVIGSEYVALNKITDTPGNYPAVNEFVSLAASVKGIVGAGVTVTYAADWSEYHHTDGGWYHLDTLWASPNIDVVGIDAYFPLTDKVQEDYDLQDAIDGWTSGEGYDWYYTDAERTLQASLSAPFAWKNIAWWWSNSHTNPDASVTSWVPESKKIWFTEYGFPSVDCATNQPNVFYDPASSDSYFPYHSKGIIDFRAQRIGIAATEQQWLASTMIERMFLWTWDARPFPYWPDLRSVWADGGNWKTGHWVQGKFGISSLAAIVADLCDKAGLDTAQYDVTRLTQLVEGYMLPEQVTIRQAIESLRQAFFFDAVESGGVITFVPRQTAEVATISYDELLPMPQRGGDDRQLLKVTRIQELELPREVNVTYINRGRNYQVGHQRATRNAVLSNELYTRELPIVFSDSEARYIADTALYEQWVSRIRYRFDVPMAYAALEPTDVVVVEEGALSHRMRIISVHSGRPGMVRVEAVAVDQSAYDNRFNAIDRETAINAPVLQGDTALSLLDLPLLPTDGVNDVHFRVAMAGYEPRWKGASLYRMGVTGGGDDDVLLSQQTASTMGYSVDALATGVSGVFDESSSVTVLLLHGSLSSATELAVLNGGNLAVVGDEIIQFRDATLLDGYKYRLSGLLRGRFGTEHAIDGHSAGDSFVLLNSVIQRISQPLASIGLSRHYRAVTLGMAVVDAEDTAFTFVANTLRPYAPVHVSASRNSGGDISIAWVRRTRSGGEWRDYVDVPLAEESESYDVEVLNGSTVVRTYNALSAPTVVYSASEQVTDFGSVQSSVSVRIYQNSALVGRGSVSEAFV